MKRLLFGCLILSGCSSLGFTNEDAGISALASDVSVPANGKVIYTIDRAPRTDAQSRQYNNDMGIHRSFLGWFKGSSGKAKTYINGGS